MRHYGKIIALQTVQLKTVTQLYDRVTALYTYNLFLCQHPVLIGCRQSDRRAQRQNAWSQNGVCSFEHGLDILPCGRVRLDLHLKGQVIRHMFIKTDQAARSEERRV